MDIVSLLEKSIADLPLGDHSTGLNAILRHIKAAIRHFERDQFVDPDTCTDAIYRTNQAFEGSLKEAYRVLTGKDPSGLNPHEIEKYLEANGVIRPRVLVQLTRYRQDYRNPSTHDYKLDFDNDEALLAIVSVCSFAKLLTNQIKSKLASNVAQEKIANRKSEYQSSDSFLNKVAQVCLDYTRESHGVDWFEYERGVSEALKSAGIESELLIFEEEGHESEEIYWDIVAKNGQEIVGIEVKLSKNDHTRRELAEITDYNDTIAEEGATSAIVIIRSFMLSEYEMFSIPRMNENILLICDPSDDDQIRTLTDQAGPLVRLSN